MKDRTEDIRVLRKAAATAHADAAGEPGVLLEISIWLNAVATCLEVAPSLAKVHALRVARAYLGEDL